MATSIKQEPQGNTVGVNFSTSDQGTGNSSVLPNSETASTKGNINWLNGSYAGADIKVVAHLYGKTNKDREMSNMTSDAELYADMATGAMNAQAGIIGIVPGGGRSTDSYLSSLRSIMGLSGKPKAEQELENRLYASFMSYIRTANRTAFNQATASVYDEYSEASIAIQTQVETMKKIENDSSTTCVLEQLQTISVQSYREKVAVRSLGKSYVSGYTRGPRTLGGSMVFTLIQEHPLARLTRMMGDAKLYGETKYDTNIATLIPDQLPPIDLTIVFANEYGSISRMGLYGVEFMTDGLTLSSEDIMTEVICQFVARDIDIPTSIGMAKLSQLNRGIYDKDGKEVSGSDVLFSSQDAYNSFLRKIGIRYAFKGR